MDPTQLTIGEIYHLEWEPWNPKNWGNAMALHDLMGNRRADLTGNDARTISLLHYGKSIHGKVTCIPKVEAHVVNHKFGPQHECELKFCVENSEHKYVKYVLTRDNCIFHLEN